jgi:hypothetical protein
MPGIASVVRLLGLGLFIKDYVVENSGEIV